MMVFLKLLFFASTFYFAVARPEDTGTVAVASSAAKATSLTTDTEEPKEKPSSVDASSAETDAAAVASSASEGTAALDGSEDPLQNPSSRDAVKPKDTETALASSDSKAIAISYDNEKPVQDPSLEYESPEQMGAAALDGSEESIQNPSLEESSPKGTENVGFADNEQPIPWVPQNSYDPSYDQIFYYPGQQRCLNEILRNVNEYLSPVMSQLDNQKQKQLTDVGMDAIASYMNYLQLMAQYSEEQGPGNLYSDNGYLNNNEILIEYDSLEPLEADSSFIPAQGYSVAE